MRLAQRLGIYGLAERLGLFKLVPGRLGQMVTLVPPPVQSGPKLPKFLPAKGRRRARVAFFVGCVADAMFRPTHWATLRVLQENGCDVVIPDGQGCCGAIHYHAGDSDGARKDGRRNVAAFDLERRRRRRRQPRRLRGDDEGIRPALARRRPSRPAKRLAAKVRDVNEFLDQLGLIPPHGRIDAVATYHDACHLGHAQKIVDAAAAAVGEDPGPGS